MDIRTISIVMLSALLLVLVSAAVAIAQDMPPPPMLPGMPDQAPIGGLGLLAAAGGAYAWKKLRNK